MYDHTEKLCFVERKGHQSNRYCQIIYESIHYNVRASTPYIIFKNFFNIKTPLIGSDVCSFSFNSETRSDKLFNGKQTNNL